jgi:hypothetical protein
MLIPGGNNGQEYTFLFLQWNKLFFLIFNRCKYQFVISGCISTTHDTKVFSGLGLPN